MGVYTEGSIYIELNKDAKVGDIQEGIYLLDDNGVINIENLDSDKGYIQLSVSSGRTPNCIYQLEQVYKYLMENHKDAIDTYNG